MRSKLKMIATYSQNLVGTDYICADIHGHFSLLEKALARVEFNPHTDRLFSLGDMIDRGDESPMALDWLQQPWFHAIQGNHERMLIDCIEKPSETMRFQWFSWGGDWAEDMSSREIMPFYLAFSRLPVAIELSLSDNQSVALVHAELPDSCNWTSIAAILSQLRADDVEADLTVSNMLWKKSQPYYNAQERDKITPVSNIDHVFHGHTIVDDYLTLGNRTFMDLGSYKTGKIGLIEPRKFLAEIKSY